MRERERDESKEMIGGLRDQGKGLGDVEVDMLGELNGSMMEILRCRTNLIWWTGSGIR